MTASDSRFRMRRVAVVLAVAVASFGCDGTGPDATLTGVWGARHTFETDPDSLTVAVTQQGAEVRGFGLRRRLAFPTLLPEMFRVHGSVTGRSVELYLTTMRFPRLTWIVRGRLGRAAVTGTMDFAGEESALTLTRIHPASDAAGTWVLASRSGPPPEDTRPIRDSVLAYPDGRAWRRRIEETSSYGSLARWFQRGDWLVLEQAIAGSFPELPFLDSLRIEPDALLRTTRALDGSTVIERFVRVSSTVAD
jgi:hypothetical protein